MMINSSFYKMANLIIPFSFTKVKANNNNNIVGRVKPNGHCKKHPKHQQSPGVCSLCLKEKLTNLSSSSSSISHKTTTSLIGSSSSSVSSLSSYVSSSSSCASPMHCFAQSGSVIFLFGGKHRIMMRSKSMAFVSSRRDREVGVRDHNNKNASKNGFWSKLLRPKREMIKDSEKDTKLLRSVVYKEKREDLGQPSHP